MDQMEEKMQQMCNLYAKHIANPKTNGKFLNLKVKEWIGGKRVTSKLGNWLSKRRRSDQGAKILPDCVQKVELIG